VVGGRPLEVARSDGPDRPDREKAEHCRLDRIEQVLTPKPRPSRLDLGGHRHVHLRSG
jgi:hypothetical protein